MTARGYSVMWTSLVLDCNEGNCKVHTLDRIDSLVSKAFGKRLSYEMLTAVI